jgi:pilus assembly protein CpaE
MKISLISSNDNIIDEVSRIIKGMDSGYSLTTFKGDVNQLTNFDDKPPSDIIILDCSKADNSQLDLLESIILKYRNVAFILLRSIVTPEFLIYAMRMGVRDVLPLPVVPADLLQAVTRLDKVVSTTISPDKQATVIAFIGVKGGVGSTFIACNFSYILAASHEKKVTLLDLDLQFGDALLYLSDSPATNDLSDLVQDISRLDGSLLASSLVNILPNFGILAAPDDAEQSEGIKSEQINALLKLAKNQNDYVVLDIGRRIDSVSVKALDNADIIFLVTQATLPCIRASKRLISTFMSLGYSKDKISLIVNRYDKNSDIQIKDVELTSGLKVFEMIPNSYDCVSASVNQGVPVMNISKNNPVTSALHEIAQKFVPGSKVKQKSWLARVFHRV